MSARTLAAAALTIAVLVGPLETQAQPPLTVGAPKAGAKKTGPARKAAKPASAPPKSDAAAPTRAKATPADSTAGQPAASRAGAAARTLEDIHIEGEIPVPQVLFITARDQRRFLEFQHQRYLRTSRKLGEETVRPSWVFMTGTDATPNKETQR